MSSKYQPRVIPPAWIKLLRFVRETRAKLQTYFPDDPIALSSHIDPECGDKSLWLYAMTALDVASAMERMDRFDHEWWLDNVSREYPCFHVNLGFRGDESEAQS